ncbi:MAG: molecular chaperone DnaJ [Caldilineaceae bacterium]|jgi:molecular chaperone DnaJ|nr:molecular chaperone DnaJ [Caldilineaceae bacterium]
MDKQDYYETLGVPRDATKDQIKKAFRKLAQQHHPDVSKSDDAGIRFKEINEAYQVLADDEKRTVYDRYGHAGLQGAAGGGFGADMSGFGDLGSIFEELFGGFGRTTGASNRRQPRRGADLRADIRLSFEEAIFGADRDMEIPRMEACDRCHGVGAEPPTAPVVCATCNGSGEVKRRQQSPLFGTIVTSTPCSTCNGVGEVIPSPCTKCRGRKYMRVTRKLSVKIPAGVDEGTRIRLAGEGEAGQFGGPPGNLYVVVSVEPHRFFVRDGSDILLELPINVAQAALGATIKIPTLEGDTETIEVPPGTQTGAQFRKRGLGAPHLQRNGRGDMLITTRVDVPSKLTAEQKELFRQLAKSFGDDTTREGSKGFFDRLFGAD